jgi:hypothetical protein
MPRRVRGIHSSVSARFKFTRQPGRRVDRPDKPVDDGGTWTVRDSIALQT